jgi:hypothetical protein
MGWRMLGMVELDFLLKILNNFGIAELEFLLNVLK